MRLRKSSLSAKSQEKKVQKLSLSELFDASYSETKSWNLR